MITDEKTIYSFLRRTHIAGEDECWHWTGGYASNNRGMMRCHGIMEQAYRVAYRIYCGPIEKGQVIMHTCDNPCCVNPKHLRTGTQYDNIHDMIAKGRYVIYKR